VFSIGQKEGNQMFQLWLDIAGKVAVILGVVFLAFQIRQQTKIARADHERKKNNPRLSFTIIFHQKTMRSWIV
jgi:hypothetical protein